MSTSDTLVGYLDKGFALLPVWGVTPGGACRCSQGASCTKGIGKHPLGRLVPSGVKDASRDRDTVLRWLTEAPDAHWAIATGEPMQGGGFLLALDCDPRNSGDVTLSQVLAANGALPETVCADTGGGGTHHLFRTSTPMRGGAIGPGLETKGVGGYVLVEPSGHHTGGSYAWRIGQSPDDLRIADAPDWLVAVLDEGSAERPVREGEGTARDTVLGEAFALSGMLGVALGEGKIAVRCPWANEHSDGRGFGQDASAVILPPAGGLDFGAFRCLHSHCAKRKWIDVLETLPAQHVAAAKKKYPMRQNTMPPHALPPGPSYEAPEGQIDPCKDPALLRRLGHRMTKGGYKLSNDPVNLTTILQYHAQWKGVLAFDEFSQIIRYCADPPWYVDDKPAYKQRKWEDHDAFRLVLWFKRYFDLDVNEAVVRSAAFTVAFQNAENPVTEWLSLLSWDGVPRLDTWLPRYLGTPDTKYTRMVGSKWMISAVARAYSPGCKADHVLILEGPQGKGKSTALESLCHAKDWFHDTDFEIGNKDAYMALRGKWIIELAELASLNKADSDKAKAFFTSKIDTYRPPYGREMASVPRRCVFAGSVNSGQYLRDETGNRRYWPVLCGVIDVDGIAADRDQIWAETVVRFRAGEKWHPEDQDQRDLAEEAQADREVEDPWVAKVAEVIGEIERGWSTVDKAERGASSLPGTAGLVDRYVTAEAILGRLGVGVADWSVTARNRVGVILARRLKWKADRRTIDKVRTKVYRPPTP